MKLVQAVTRKVVLRGLTDIMFDRYAGDNKTQLRPDQRMYLKHDGSLFLPNLNIVSLLTAVNTPSAPQRFLGRAGKSTARAILSYTIVGPSEVPFMRDGRPIVFNGFDENGVDKAAAIYVRKDVARLEKGIPNPKERPVLSTPWELRFDLSLYPNTEVSEDTVQNLLIQGGLAIGLGTFRGVFGKFAVDAWE